MMGCLPGKIQHHHDHGDRLDKSLRVYSSLYKIGIKASSSSGKRDVVSGSSTSINVSRDASTSKIWKTINFEEQTGAEPEIKQGLDNENGSSNEPQQASLKNSIKETISCKKRPQKDRLSKHQRELDGLMEPTSAFTTDVKRLRNALSGHAETAEMNELNANQSINSELEKKLSAEIVKEKEVNQKLREFKDGSETRKTERRLSIPANHLSLHVIPEHHDEPSNPEVYQYSETNVYF